MPTISSLKVDYGIDPKKKDEDLSEEEKSTIDNLKELLMTERKAFISRKTTLQSNYPKLFGLIWGQCIPSLQQELRNLPKYKESYDTRDCLWLLNELKKSSSGSDTTQHEMVTFIRTVASQNKEYFTRKEIEGTDNAGLLQGHIGWPGQDNFKSYVATGQLLNCTTTVDDINCGLAIYGPDKAIVKGKMTRKWPQHIQHIPRVEIPSPVLKQHPCNDVAVDFFFVQSRIYLLMKSRIYKFQGINLNCRGRGKVETSTAIRHFINRFSLRGIKVNAIYRDNEFEKISELVAPINMWKRRTCS